MAACPNRSAEKRTSFVVTPYSVSKGGVMVPAWPSAGPCAGLDEPSCHLVKKDWRDRVTGPCFPLRVLRCTTHERAFTLYPPGHVPYGREVVAPVAPDGTALRDPSEAVSDPVERLRGTVFDAALDAAARHPWSREYTGRSDWAGTWWGVMQRRLEILVFWLGIAPNFDPSRREERALALDLDLLVLIDAARLLEGRVGYRSRGAAVTAILREIETGPRLLERLLLAGYVAGLWGEPLLWDPQRQTLRSLAGEPHSTRRGPTGPDPPRLRAVVRPSVPP